MTDKIIIHNYTKMSDKVIMKYITNIINYGKISNCKYGKTYCFLSRAAMDRILISCIRRNNTYTFKIFEE